MIRRGCSDEDVCFSAPEGRQSIASGREPLETEANRNAPPLEPWRSDSPGDYRPYGAHGLAQLAMFQVLTPLATNRRPVGAGAHPVSLLQSVVEPISGWGV